VRIRPAQPDDATVVAALEQELFGLDAWTAAAVVDELDPARRRALVAERDGEVVGYAVASVAGDVADLHRVAVAVRVRRHGLGTALLAHLREACRAAGATRMLLEVSASNDAALAFYAAEGWVDLDRRPRYYRDGSDALVLSLDLIPETV
jgi:ribosomal-protein-alanine N-acetyltransferase